MPCAGPVVLNEHCAHIPGALYCSAAHNTSRSLLMSKLGLFWAGSDSGLDLLPLMPGDMGCHREQGKWVCVRGLVCSGLMCLGESSPAAQPFL